MTTPQRLIALMLCAALGAIAQVGPARAETVLRVLEWEGYLSTSKEKFERHAKSKGLDIRLEFVQPYISGPEDIYKKVRFGQADVVTPTNNYFKLEDNKLAKLLAPIDFSKLPHYDRVNAALRDADYDRIGAEKFSVPLLGGSYGLAYNAARVDAPTTWSVLWDPANKGRVSVTGAQIEANFYTALLLDGVDPTILYDFFDLAEGEAVKTRLEQRIRDLRANTQHYWQGIGGDFGNGVDKAVMDELNYSTTYWFMLKELRDRGGDWRIASPAEGQTIWLDTMAIAGPVKDDPAKWEAAHLLLDFMLADEQQQFIHDTWGSVVVNANVAKKVGVEDFYADTRLLWRPLSKRTQNYYNNLWRKYD